MTPANDMKSHFCWVHKSNFLGRQACSFVPGLSTAALALQELNGCNRQLLVYKPKIFTLFTLYLPISVLHDQKETRFQAIYQNTSFIVGYYTLLMCIYILTHTHTHTCVGGATQHSHISPAQTPRWLWVPLLENLLVKDHVLLLSNQPAWGLQESIGGKCVWPS